MCCSPTITGGEGSDRDGIRSIEVAELIARIDRCGPQMRAIDEGKIQFRALSCGHYPGARLDPEVIPGIPTMGFWDAVGAQDWGEEIHCNEGLEICYLETGSMPCMVEGNTRTLNAGDLLLTRPWQLHRLGNPNIGPGRLHWLVIDVGVRSEVDEWRWPRWVVLQGGDRGELARLLRENRQPLQRCAPEIAEAFRGLARAMSNASEPHSYSRLIVCLNELLLGLLDVLSRQQRPVRTTPDLQEVVAAFFNRIERDAVFAAEPWTVERLARKCGLGVTALSKHSRLLTNTGPMEYLNLCRLDHAARRLLAAPTETITEVALQVGFNSGQYFATRFRERFHCTPSEYRTRAHAADLAGPCRAGR